MRIISNPKIYMLGKFFLDWEVVDRYLSDHQTSWLIDQPRDGSHDLDLATEFAGRVCYDAFGKAQHRTSNQEYLANILEQEHGSVLEHSTVMLLVEGISRSLTHELIRHRVGIAYSQRSQRYVDESDAGFVVPPELLDSPSLQRVWKSGLEEALNSYTWLTARLTRHLEQTELATTDKRSRRIRAKQAARSLLPNATETTIVMTANLRTLRHICQLRGSIYAEREIRRFAVALARLMKEQAPNAFQDITVELLSDGIEGVAGSRKV